MSNPNWVRTYAKPNPIPSVAPVITAQHYLLSGQEYFVNTSFRGIIYLINIQIVEIKNLANKTR